MWRILLVTLLAAAGAAAQTQPTTASSADGIVAAPWGRVHVENFAPRDEPQDLAYLPGGRRAVADALAFVGWSGGALDGQWDAGTQTLTVTSIGSIRLQGFTRVRQSTSAGQTIRAHEAGHDTLNANEWQRSALVCTQTAVKGFLGSTFHGAGAGDAEAQDDAWKQARADRDQRMSNGCAAILQRMTDLGRAYDFYTDHGRSPAVDSEKGVRMALQKRDTAAAKP